MTDFEERLIASLRSAADDAPPAAGLADAARARRTRRRRTTALTSAAAVAAVVAVVGGVALLGSGGGGTPDRCRSRTTRRAPTARATGTPCASRRGATSRSRCRRTGATGTCRPGASTGRASPGRPVVERPGAMRRVDRLHARRRTATASSSSTAPAGRHGLRARRAVAVRARRREGLSRRRLARVPALGRQPGPRRRPESRPRPSRCSARYVTTRRRRPDGNGCLPTLRRGRRCPDGQVRLCRYSLRRLAGAERAADRPRRGDAVAALDAAPASPCQAVPEPAAMTGSWSVDRRPEMRAGGDSDPCAGLRAGATSTALHRRRPALGALARLERPGPRRHHLRAASLEVVGDDQGVGVGPGRDV